MFFFCSIKSKYKSAHSVSGILKCNITYEKYFAFVYVLGIYLNLKLMALIYVLKKSE